MLRLGALTTVYVNNKNNTAHISKKKKRNKKGKRRGKKKKNSLRQRQRTARGKRARFGSGVKLARISGAYRKSNSEVNKVTRRISFCLQERRLPKQQLTQPSSHSTPSCIAVSELKWWQRRVAVRPPPPKFTSRIPSSPQLNKHNHTGWEHGNTAPPPAALPPRWQKVQLCDWEVSLFLKIELSFGVLWVSHCRPLKTSLVGS